MKKHKAEGKPKFFEELKKYCPEEVSKISAEDGENSLIYGTPCKRIEKGYAYEGAIFLSDSLSDYIGFANKYYDNIEKLSIKNIRQITFPVYAENLIGYTKSFPGEVFFQILIGQKTYDFCLEDKQLLLTLVRGLLSIFQNRTKKIHNIDTQLTMIVNKYDKNFDKILDYNEFREFAKSIGYDHKTLMMEVDANKDGIITNDEVKKFLEIKTSGRLYQNVFNRFSSKKEGDKENSMDPNELKNFFHTVQEEFISDLEAYQLVITFLPDLENNIQRKINKKIENSYIKNNYQIVPEKIELILLKMKVSYGVEVKLKLFIKDFNSMLNSHMLNVLKEEKIRENVNLDRPLTDYFINSTHNTYITGNQLAGDSSIKMYSLSLLEGHRLVELDCYNGEGDDIVITHGYTLISKLHLVDILKELRESAFQNSNLPVILSIENHLDKYHQEIMAKQFQEILKDLYIFPAKEKPDHIPTLREMQKKFIIKCGGKRVWLNDEIPRLKSSINVNLSKHVSKLKKFLLKDRLIDVVDSDEEDLKKPRESIVFLDNDDKKLKKVFMINTNETLQNNQSNVKKQFGFLRNLKDQINKLPKLKSQNSKDEDEEIKEEETYQTLEEVRGLLGAKYDANKIEENNYKSWEILTLKSKKFTNAAKDILKRKEFIKLSQHCLFKAYPESFGSWNYNVIKCWQCGCQAAAINIQALEDDYTLFNKIFFFQNRRCGYVLKPNKLLDNNLIDDIIKEFEKPSYILRIKLYSLYNLMPLIEATDYEIRTKGKISMEIYSLENDDKNNLHYKFSLHGGLVFPEIENITDLIDIKVFDPDLGGVMIKILYDNFLIGRSCIPYCLIKPGIRRLPVFDNDCWLCDDTFLVGCLEKVKVL